MADAKVILTAQNNIKAGLDSAKGDVKGFGDVAEQVGNTIKNAFKFLAIIEALQKLGEVGKECFNEFAEGERRANQLKIALDNNVDSFNKNNELIGKMSKLTLSSKDDVETLVTELAALGKSDKEIEAITKASVNLSNITGKDLNSSFQMVNATMEGSAGKLGKLIPEMGDLTKEQLKSGEAAALINEKFTEMSEKLAERNISQKLKNIGDDIGDIKEGIGQVIAVELGPLISKFGSFISQSKDKIITIFQTIVAVFENFPEVAKLSFKLVLDLLQATFSWNGLKIIFVSLAKYIGETLATVFTSLPTLFWDVVKLMFTPIKTLGDYMADTLGKAIKLDFKNIQSPGDFLKTVLTDTTKAAGKLVTDLVAVVGKQANNVKDLGVNLSHIYDNVDFKGFAQGVQTVIAPTMAKFAAVDTTGVLALPAITGPRTTESPDNNGTSKETYSKYSAIPNASFFGKDREGFDPEASLHIGRVAALLLEKVESTSEGLRDDTNFGRELQTSIGDLGASMALYSVSPEDQKFYDESTGYLQDLVQMRDDTKYGREIFTAYGQQTGATLAEVISKEDQDFYDKLTGYLDGSVFMRDDTNYGREIQSSAADLGATMALYEVNAEDMAFYLQENGKYLEKLLAKTPGSFGQSGISPTNSGTSIADQMNTLNSSKPSFFQNLLGDFNGVLTDLKSSFGSGFMNTITKSGLGGGDILGSLSGMFSGLASALGPLTQIIFSANPIMAALLPIIQGAVSILGPAITEVIQPLMMAFDMIGKTLGIALLPILDAISPIFAILANILQAVLMPVIQLLSPFIEMIALSFQMLSPILNLVAKAFTILMSPVQFIGDLFSWLGKWISALGTNIGVAIYNLTHWLNPKSFVAGPAGFTSDAFTGLQAKLDAIDNIGSTDLAGAATATVTQTASQSASYSGSNQITINIYQQAPIVGDGGMSAFAKMIRNEIATLDYYNL
jgi:hypothetical protein